MEGYRIDSYGDGFADVYDDWYGDVSPPAATAAFLAARTTGPVLELGSGTGRLAAPIAAAGVAVVGLDASRAMLARARDRHPQVAVVGADMAALPVRPASIGAVLVAFNTLFNLDDAGQRRCLADVAAVLAPGGLLVVEAFVPGSGMDEGGDRLELGRLDADVVVLRASRTDPSTGVVAGAHVELRDGAPVRVRPWRLQVRTPEQLDAMASGFGLGLLERHGGWSGEPFDEAADVHVSVYRRSPGASLVSGQ